jgi:hypothetical protein
MAVIHIEAENKTKWNEDSINFVSRVSPPKLKFVLKPFQSVMETINLTNNCKCWLKSQVVHF